MHIAIIGGGVIGLSLAWELAQRGKQVTVLDRQELGTETSWAGAGILPPANFHTANDSYDRLRGWSMNLHPEWSQRLRERTGIDTGLRKCGGIYLARTRGEVAALVGFAGELQEQDIPCLRLSAEQLQALEPNLAAGAEGQVRVAYHLPTEYQIRNPWLLRALIRACELAGVKLCPQQEVTRIETAGQRATAIVTANERFSADQFCLAAGSWTSALLKPLEIETSVIPIRGQIVLYRCDRPPLKCVVNEGSRYLVPREDGLVLVGSTEEEVGFQKENTPAGIAGLREYAESLVPALRSAEVVRTWAGLRPSTFDGFPYLGRASGWGNLYVAAGHFRSGIYLSPATAVLMSQLICGETPAIDLSPFRLQR